MNPSPSRLRTSVAVASWLAVAGWGSALSAQAPPPDEDWRTIETEHFRVTYGPGLEPLARQAGAVAERTYAILAEQLVDAPDGAIDIVVTDHADYSNGYAFAFPSNRIVIHARPATEPQLAFARDWMELLVAHELVHTFHLDDAGPLGRAVRAVLGRVPMVWPLFPGIRTPAWNVEGLATHYESALTGSGRIPGSFHDMIIRTAALEGEIPDLDHVSSPHPAWPGGHRSYAYGSRLMRYIADRYGPDAHRAILEATAASVLPTFLFFDHVAERAVGRPFDAIYDDWRATETRAARTTARRLRTETTATEPVVDAGPYAVAPRIAPDGARLSYGAHDYRSDPATRIVDLASGRIRTLARRNQGGALLGPAAWLPDGSGVVVAQLELDGPYRARSDLWRVDLDGEERRLTHGARLAQPDVAADGRIVAVRDRAGGRDLVIHEPGTGETRTVVASAPGDAFDGPRWSPDGRNIAVGRLNDGRVDLVVVDPTTGIVRPVTADDALDLAPTWSPDGRWLLWWSDRSGIPNILAAEIADPSADRRRESATPSPGGLEPGSLPAPRRITRVLTGAFDPELSPDGRTLYASVYHHDGWRIERLPFEPEAAPVADPSVMAHAPGLLPEPEPATAATAGSAPSPYAPWSTLRPRFWLPQWELLGGDGGRLSFPGLTSWGSDLVGRHAWALTAAVDPRDGRVQGRLEWTWRRPGNPVFTARARRDWDRVATLEFGDGVAETFFRRTDELRLDATVWRARWRSRGWLALGAEVERRETQAHDMTDAELQDREIRILELPTLAGLTVGPGWSNARRHPFSISEQDGIAASVGIGRWWNLSEGGHGYDEVAARLAGYLGLPLWGFADHVLAARVAGTLRQGDFAPARAIGGVPGGTDPLGLSSGASYAVRGFDSGDRWGTRAWTASMEWRFPIHMTPAPGGGQMMGFSLTSLSGSVFADLGSAWCPGTERETVIHACETDPDPLASIGAELTIDFGAFHNDRVVLRAGIAMPLRGPGDRATLFMAFGPAF